MKAKEGCKIHGIDSVYQKKRGDWQCRKCHAGYINNARTKIRDELISRKGGKCEKCGYDKCNDALCFHHLKDKKFTLSKVNMMLKSQSELNEELEKCTLLCANCHAEIHSASVDQLAESTASNTVQ